MADIRIISFMRVVSLRDDNWDVVLQETINCLNQGGVVILPTDTVYGIAASAYDEQALKKLFSIKKRDPDKPLPVFIDNSAMAHEIAHIDNRLDGFLKKIWPGAVTVVVPKKIKLPDLVTANLQSVGLRIPQYTSVIRLLAQLSYPLAVTSANISGEDDIFEASQIMGTFSDIDIQPDLFIDAGDLPKSKPSTIIDFTEEGKPRILREGAVLGEGLLQLFKNF